MLHLAGVLTDKIIGLSDKQAQRLFVFLFVLFHAAQFLVVGFNPYSLSADEAHYWDWARHLDIAYYSKGPLIALLIAGSTAVWGHTEFAVRFPGLLCSAAFSACSFIFMRSLWGGAAALFGWLLVRTTLYFSVLGLVMTTDPPLILFWLAAVALIHAAVTGGSTWCWPAAGICMGLAVLSKYTALILPVGVLLFVAFSPELRKRSLLAHLFACFFLAASSLVPVVVWNAAHGWVNIQHNAGHLISSKAGLLRLKYLPELIGGQLGLIGPLVFPAVCWVLFDSARNPSRQSLGRRLFFWSAAPLGLVCLSVSLTKRVYANWPAPLFIGGLLLLVRIVVKEGRGSLRNLLGVGILLNLLICTAAFFPIMGFTLGVPAHFLTTKKLVGWDELGSAAQNILSELPGETFVLAADYEHAAAIGFYAESHPQVFVANLGDRRMNQYDIWGGLESEVGKDALIVVDERSKADLLAAYFAEIEQVRSPLEVIYAGSKIREFFFYKGLGYNGRAFPALVRY